METVDVFESLVRFLALPADEMFRYAPEIPNVPADCVSSLGFSRSPLEEIASGYLEFCACFKNSEYGELDEVVAVAIRIENELENMSVELGSLPWTKQGIRDLEIWRLLQKKADELSELAAWPKEVPSVSFRQLVKLVGD